MIGRSLITSLFVGTVLFAVNSGGAVMEAGLTCRLFTKLVVTMVIPFCVSLISAVLTQNELREGARSKNDGQGSADCDCPKN